MSNSRLKSAAERLSIVGNSLSDPRDIAVARKYVEELKALAAREVTATAEVSDATPEDMRVKVVGSTLRRAYPALPASRFRDLLDALD